MPGSQLQRQAENRASRRSRSSQSSGANGACGNPDVWSITCSTVIASLPFVANSGISAATGVATSTSPSPIRIHIAPATTAFVAEKMTYRDASGASPNVRQTATFPSRASAS